MRLIVVTCLLAILSGCHRNSAPTRLRTSHATCESTCDYYQYCKGSQEEGRYGACISDCRSIFSEDGEMDRGALLQLQRLECPALLSFIEGEDGQALAPQSQKPISESGVSTEL